MFLKNKNIIFKLRRSKVTDYAALKIYLDIHFRDKSDKKGIFDVVKSCFLFDKYIFSE